MIWAADSLPSSSAMRPSTKALALLGGVVLGVLRQVAMRTRFGNGVNHDAAFLGLELVQLFAGSSSAPYLVRGTVEFMV